MPDEGKPDSLPATASAAVAAVAVPPAAGIPAEAAALARATLASEPEVTLDDIDQDVVDYADTGSTDTGSTDNGSTDNGVAADSSLSADSSVGDSNPSNNDEDDDDRDSLPTQPRSLVPLPEGYSSTTKRSSIPPGKLSLSAAGKLQEHSAPATPSQNPAPGTPAWLPNPAPSAPPPVAPAFTSGPPPPPVRKSDPAGVADSPGIELPRPPASSQPPIAARPPGPPSKPPGSAALTPMRIIEVKRVGGAPPGYAPGPAQEVARDSRPNPPPAVAPVAPVSTPPAAVVPSSGRAAALNAEAPTPPDTPVAVAQVAAARISLSPDAPTPPETPALRRDLWQRISGATPPEMKAVRDADDDGARVSVQPGLAQGAATAATARRSANAEDGLDVHVGEGHDVLEAISEDELTEVDAVSDRAPEVKPARRLPRRPAKRTTFSDLGGDPKRRHWWEELWSDDFERAELPLPAREFLKEVDFIESSLALEPGGVVLDLACGAGPYSIELARRGYTAVGYDLSPSQLQRAGEDAERAGQKVNFLQGDVRDMEFDAMFDGVVCWNTSFGFFEEEKNQQTLANVFKALKPGGSFLLDIPNRDFVLRHQPMQSWFEGDACVCMDDTYIDFITSRLCVKRTVMLDDGRNREWYYSLRLYALHEVGKMLHDLGFKVAQISGHVATRGAFLGGYSPRVIALAIKPS